MDQNEGQNSDRHRHPPVDEQQRIDGRSPGSRLKWRQIPSQILLQSYMSEVLIQWFSSTLLSNTLRCCFLRPNRIQLRGQLQLPVERSVERHKYEFPINPVAQYKKVELLEPSNSYGADHTPAVIVEQVTRLEFS